MAFQLENVVIGWPDTTDCSECPDCGYDAVLTFPVLILTPDGFDQIGTYAACGRCAEEEERNDGG